MTIAVDETISMAEAAYTVMALVGLFVELVYNLRDAVGVERNRRAQGKNGDLQLIAEDAILNSLGRALVLGFIVGYGVLVMQLMPPTADRATILTYVTWGYPFLSLTMAFLSFRARRTRQLLLRGKGMQ